MEHLESSKKTKVQALPNVFYYKNYRVYLKDWVLAKKKFNKSYSAAIFAKKAGLNSHNLLGMVIRDERNLSWKSINGFCKSLNLKVREKLYFEKLVLFCQAKNSEDKADFFEQLLQLSKGHENKLLDKIKDYKSYYRHWYIVAIREMVNLEDFQEDPGWITEKLKHKITKKQATEAWKTLKRIGMVRFNKERRVYEVVNAVIDYQNEGVDFVLRNFHKEYLHLTLDTVDGDIEERELSSLTIAVTDEDLKEIKKKIDEYRKYLNLIYTKTKEEGSKQKPQNLIVVNIHLLDLTSRKSKGEKNK